MGRLFGPEKRQAFPSPPVMPYPGAPMPGHNRLNLNSTDGALIVPAVWACVSLLANSVSTLPLKTYRQDNQDVAIRVDDPPLVRQPEPNATQSEWIHKVMLSLLLRGNAYGMVTSMDNLGYPTSIVILDPDEVTGRQDRETGRVEYRLNGKLTPHTRFGIDGPNADIWHLPGLALPGRAFGLSPIEYAAAALGIDISSRQFASDFFDGSSIPKAVLESDQEVDQEQAQTLKDRVMSAMRKREPIVLGAGLRFSPLTVKPEEAQFIATQHFSVAQIARFYNIPPEMVGGDSGHANTYANREQRAIDFLTYTVSFWLKRIEDSMWNLLPGKRYVEFDVKHLIRTDAETTAAVHIQEIASKLRTPTEIRMQDLHMPEMTDDQKAEVNMVPLIMNVIGGSKLGVKVNTELEKQQAEAAGAAVGNYGNTGDPAKVTGKEDDQGN